MFPGSNLSNSSWSKLIPILNAKSKVCTFYFNFVANSSGITIQVTHNLNTRKTCTQRNLECDTLWLMKHMNNHTYVKTCLSWHTCMCITAMYTQLQLLHTCMVINSTRNKSILKVWSCEPCNNGSNELITVVQLDNNKQKLMCALDWFLWHMCANA